MIEQICAFIHNFFYGDRYSGTFRIVNGALVVPGLIDGQWYRICGSRLNDGVYRYGVDELEDETFTGTVWDMRPPKSFLKLVEEIEAWNDKYSDVMNSPYSSESFGGYSYSKAQGFASAGGGMLSSWQTVFGTRLKEWRKIA